MRGTCGTQSGDAGDAQERSRKSWEAHANRTGTQDAGDEQGRSRKQGMGEAQESATGTRAAGDAQEPSRSPSKTPLRDLDPRKRKITETSNDSPTSKKMKCFAPKALRNFFDFFAQKIVTNDAREATEGEGGGGPAPTSGLEKKNNKN